MKKYLFLLCFFAIVLPAFAGIYTIGTGTSGSNNAPFNGYYDYNWSKAIYTQSELNAAGLIGENSILSIGFFVINTPVNYTMNDQRVYLRHSDLTAYATSDNDHPDRLDFHEGFNGTLTYNGGGWFYINFIEPFNWNGMQGIEFLFENRNGGWASAYPTFAYTSSSPDYRMVYKQQDSSFPQGLTGTLSYNRPNIQIITPTSHPPNATTLVAPADDATMISTSISLAWNSAIGADGYKVYLGTNPTPPFVANVGNINTYSPAALENDTTYYWQIVPYNAFGDAGECPTWSFTTAPEGLVIIGDGEETSRYPLGSYYGYERSASLYTAAEIGGDNRRISALGWYATQAANDNVPTKIYLKNHPTTIINAATWANFIQGATLVFDSTVNGVQANDWNIFSLANTFDLDSGDNLLVLVERNYGGSGGSAGSTAPAIRGTTLANMHHSVQADSNPPIGNTTAQTSRPNIMIFTTSYEMTEPPNPAYLVAPANGASKVDIRPTLSWASGGGAPTGFKLYFGSSNPPEYLQDMLDATTYTPTTDLEYESTYYWQIVPYNSYGDANDCPVWSFTTKRDILVYSYPFHDGFEDNNVDGMEVDGWEQALGSTYTNYWLANSAQSSYNRSPRTGDFNATLRYGSNAWLMRPFYLEAGTNYEFSLWARQDISNADAAVVRLYWSTTNDINEMANLTVQGITNGDYQRVSGIIMPEADGVYWLAINATVSNAPWYLSIDDIEVKEPAADPLLAITPLELHFGEVGQYTYASLPLYFTNIGGGYLNGEDIELYFQGEGLENFSLESGSISSELGADESASISVMTMPLSEGVFHATLIANYGEQHFEIPLSVTGLPEGTVVIGHEEQRDNLPIYPYYGYSYSQSIYYAHEIDPYFSGTKIINRLAYYWNGAQVANNSNDWTVYMGHKGTTTFTAQNDWLPLSQMQQVFSGTVALPATEGWLWLELNAPFVFDGSSNLVIAVDENSNGFDSNSHYFYCSEDYNYRSLLYFADSINPNPQSPPNGTLIAGYPNVRFEMLNIPPYPQISIHPTSLDFGEIMLNASKELSLLISNTGGDTLRIADIYLEDEGLFVLESPYLPIELGTGESLPITVMFIGELLGNHSTNLIINHETAQTTVPLSATCYDPTISSFPYYQDFDGEWTGTPPAPYSWQVVDYDNDGITWSQDNIYLGSAHSGNWVAHGMGNMDDYLISPPLNLGERNVILKWWDKVESAMRPCNYQVLISDHGIVEYGFGDTLTNINCTNTDWQQQELDLSDYNGQTVYIAFHQYYSSATNYGFGIDDVSFSEIPDLDVPPAPALALYPLPAADMVSINPILRWESATGEPNGYKVYLGTNNPPPFVYDTFQNFYSPSTLQNEQIYFWKVVPYNEYGDAIDCPVWSFTTTSDNMMIIGHGAIDAQLPINPGSSYSYSQSIYSSSDIHHSREYDMSPNPLKIDKISYYWHGGEAAPNSNQWDVFMKNSWKSSFADGEDWVPVSEQDRVFSGSFELPATAGWVEIELDRAFFYELSSNLLIAVKENQDGFDNAGLYFHSTAYDVPKSLIFYSDAMNPNPFSPPEGLLCTAMPNILISYYHSQDYSTPILELPSDIYFIRNSTLNMDFRDYIEWEGENWDDISISIEPAEAGTGFDISYLPVNQAGIPGQYLVNISSPLQWEYQQQFVVTALNHENGRATTAFFTLHLLEHFSATFATDDIYQYTGQTVQFIDNTLGNPNYWLWDFGDGATSSLQHPSHIYTQSGTYHVSLTLGHLEADEESSITYYSYIEMQGTAVDPDDLPDTWDPSGSPYNLFGGLEIPEDEELTIEEGVEVLGFSPEPMVISGSLNAAGVTFNSGNPDSTWGGLRFVGSSRRNEPSLLEGCTIINAILPLDIEDSSPSFQNLYIAPADTTQMQVRTGIRIVGESNPEINELELLNYSGGIQIQNDGSGRALPLLTNIRIRNSGSTSRPEGQRSTGISLDGNLELNDAEIESTDTAIEMQGNSNPLMTNIRIRNSGSTSRNSNRKGIAILGNSSPTLAEVEIDDVEYGIVIEDGDSDIRAATSPLLTNIRIRNSGSTSREVMPALDGIVGIMAQGECNLSLEDVEVEGFATGIRLLNLERATSSPLLTNIRIRNSGSTSRDNSLGMELLGDIIMEMEDIIIEDYANGLRYHAEGEARTTSSPLMTNIRIRNSGSTSRNTFGNIGMDFKGLESFECVDDSISGYQIGMKIAGTEMRTTSSPLLTNIRIRNSGSTSREENIGILLEDNVIGHLKDSTIEEAGIGVKISSGNATLLENLQIYNCFTGIQMAGNNQQRKLKGHLIALESAYLQAHPSPDYRALALKGAANWLIQQNTISGYGKILSATNTGTGAIDFSSNIAWTQQVQTAPFSLVNASISANYNTFHTAQPFAGEGNLSSNPIFVNAAIRNYHLHYNSPCIDSGSPLLPLEPDGTRADMGAYTYLHRASVEANTHTIEMGSTVHFTNTSWGHDYPQSICQWDLNDDGQIDSTTRDWQYQFNRPGVYSLRLTMTTGSLTDTRLYEAYIVVQPLEIDAPQALSLSLQDNDIQLNWEPVSFGSDQQVEYYLVYAADEPEGAYQYVGHTTNYQHSYTHIDGGNAPRRFYCVISFSGTPADLQDFIDNHQIMQRN